MHSAESAKGTELNKPRIATMEPVSKKKKSRLDFGETDPSVLLYYSDPFPNRTYQVTTPSSREVDRIIFTAHQKSQLEALFLKEKFPDRKEKATLAARIDVPLEKVMTWFGNRRRRWRKKQKKGLVGPSGSRPVLPGSRLIQTTYQSSFQSTAVYSRSAEFPARLQVHSQRFPFTPYQVNVQLPSASNFMTRPPTAVLPALRMPWQQVYQPFPAPAHKVPQQYPDAYYQPWEVSSFPSNYSIPVKNPVPELPEIRQVPFADSNSLADQFPFPYSFDEDGVLERLLMPSFELPVDLESICDSLSELDQSVETSSQSSGTSEALSQPDCLQPASSHRSCCHAGDNDYSCGSVSKGRDFCFCRED